MTEPIEIRLQALAREFKYPATPPVANLVMDRLRVSTSRPRNRQFAWALVVVIALLAGLMFVPPVRAAVLDFIQIGIVRIFPENSTPTIQAPLTATPAPTPESSLPFLEALAGETTLEEVQAIVDFPIPLPPELDAPERVYLQDANGWMVILVWRDPQQPNQIEMSLHIIEAGSWTIEKYQPAALEETTVHDQRAVWTSGPYPLILSNGNIEFASLIEGHVLIWEEKQITYRLEIDSTLEDAVRIAESLQVQNP
ncbi:MAG: hypothetical protein IH588_16800 [Anaerolineales bacterium]|nr:hypothetical protein [Anaerolineales bacterium]